MTLASTPLWAVASISAAQTPPPEPPITEEPPLQVAAPEPPSRGCCALWTIVPIELGIAALFGGLVAGALTLGEHREGYTSASYTIDQLNADHDKARTGAIVADGFYIAAAGGLIVQLGVMLPLCLTTEVCETELATEGEVKVSKRGELVIRW